MFCRSASIVSPRTSPYTKLLLFKCIYVLSVTQNNLLVYLAFVGCILPLGSLTNITRSVVWGNFATVVECTLMYFIAARLYKIEDYNHHSLVKEAHFGKPDQPEGAQYLSKTLPYEDNAALERYSEDSLSEYDEERGAGEMERKINSSINEKLQNMTIKLVSESDREQYHKLAYSDSDDCSVSTSHSKRFRKTTQGSVEGMFGPVKGTPQAIALKRVRAEQDQVSVRSYSGSTRSSRCDIASVRSSRADVRGEDVEPRIRIVGGKLNISLSTKDIAKLTKCERALEEEEEEEVVRRSDRRKRRSRSRNSMQFLKLSKYNTLEDDQEGMQEGTLVYDETQCQEAILYDEKDATLKYEDKDATLKFDEHQRSAVNTSIEDYDFNPDTIERTSSVSSVSGKYVSKISLV